MTSNRTSTNDVKLNYKRSANNVLHSMDNCAKLKGLLLNSKLRSER